MAQNYTRQSSLSDGDTITASLFNDEYNQLVNAFTYSSTSASSTGHRHDGSSGQGGNIFKIGDLDFLNKIEVDSTNNRWGFYVEVSSAAVEQIRIQDGAVVPVTDNDIDLGTTSLEFKDLFIDGTAHIDTLDVDENATVAGTLGVTGTTTLTGNVTTTNDLSVGGNLTVTGTTTFNGGTITMGDAATDNVVFGADVDSNIIPDDDDTYDLGSSSQEWRNLYIDGTANIDSLVADTADINGGTIDGTVIGGTTPASITGTAITGTSFVIGSANISESELETIDGITAGTVAASKAVVVDANKDATGFRNITITGELDAATLDVSGNIDVDGVTNLDVVDIDGAVDFASTTAHAGDASFADNAKAIFGAGSDLQIYHSGSASFIDDAGVGDLNLRAFNDLNIKNINNDNIAVRVRLLDGSEYVELHHAGSTKLATTSTGIDVTGVITTDGMTTSADINFGDNDRAVFGAGSDLEIYHDGTTSIIKDAGTGELQLHAENNLRLQNLTGSTYALFSNGAAASLYYNGSAKLATTSTGINVTGTAVIETGSGNTYPTASTSADNLVISDKTASTPVGITIFSDNASQGNIFFGDENDADNGRIVYDHNGNANTMSFFANGAERLSVDSTGIDVTGSVTADAAEIDVTRSNTAGSGFLTLDLIGTGGDFAHRVDTSNAYYLDYYTGATWRPTVKIEGQTGDISFYEDTGTTAKLFWDASAESLGIGTTSPDTPLHISTNVQAVAQLESSHANGSYAIWAVGGTKFGDVGSNKGISGSGNTTDFMIASRSTYPLLLGTGSTERMRIDSSGHVIVKNGGRFYLESSSGFSPFLSESSNNLLFTVNSSEAMRIDSSGRVGIGTTPVRVLDIATTTGGTIIHLTDDATGHTATDGVDLQQEGTLFQILNREAGDIRFGTNNTERMRIDSSGHIGINVTSSLDQKINIADTADVGIKMTKTGSITTTMRAVGGALAFGVDGGSGTTERMRIDSSGRVGIGTSPSQPLHVDATGGTTAALFDNNGTNGDVVRVAKNGTDILKIRAEGTADVALDASGGAFIFKEGGSEAVRIDSSGNVGIGTSNTTFVNGIGLKIANATAARLILTDSTNGVGSEDGLQFTQSGTNAYFNLHENGFMAFNTNNTERMRLDASGNLLVAKTAINASTTGIQIEANGTITATRAGRPFILNRTNTDGDLIELRKDNAKVGSIGTSGGLLVIGDSDCGIAFEDGTTNHIYPWNVSGGAANDNAISLGSSSARYKDLYLSGDLDGDSLKILSGQSTTPTNDGSPLIYKTSSHSDYANGDLIIQARSSASRDIYMLTGTTTPVNRLQVNGNGDISFYNSAGTSQSLFWDSSAESLGIGTSSPSSKLHLSSSSEVIARLTRSAGTNALVLFQDPSSTTAPYIGSYGNSMAFGRYAGGESMRIDSSGRVGIGVSSPDVALHVVTGGSNEQFHVQSPTPGMKFIDSNLTTRVFTIGGENGNVSIHADPNNASGSSHILLRADGSTIAQFDSAGLKFFGDTATANALDDYEEGTWTPALEASTTNPTGTVVVNNATYTKVGRMVHVQAYITVNVTNVGAGGAQITGLPFTVGTGYASVKFSHGSLILSNGGYFNNGSTRIIAITDHSTSSIGYSGTGAGKALMLSGIYEVA